ncbi:thermonuclease family protein [Shinella sp. DD12]|uniref:thermonuclease family protein n=1 Tax=Shinella sp. DD12 TaxID=1410620 RepID=UPI0003C539D0|nr:thermonuclease family protein [Shinella sp. DD12]EYR81383.1 succinoglycan biosynthesis protein ExoI [Shinella sp. DD12]
MLARLTLLSLLISPAQALATDIVGRASVIDGDTIDIQGTRIRFDGIDAPESRQRCMSATGEPYRCGKVSADALDAFLAESRPVSCHKTGSDRGRIVAICTRADGADVNRWLVASGYAIDWPKYSKGRYADEQRQAEAAGAGIWAGAFERPCVVRGSRCD